MSIQYFTKYLGAQVKFTHKHWFYSDRSETVEGVISEVLIKQDLENCEFVVGNEFYEFNSVNFISELLSSEEVS